MLSRIRWGALKQELRPINGRGSGKHRQKRDPVRSRLSPRPPLKGPPMPGASRRGLRGIESGLGRYFALAASAAALLARFISREVTREARR